MRERTLDPAELGTGTVSSFLALRGLATITEVEPKQAVLCTNEPFHWNGSELVICSIGPAAWSGRESDMVEVSLVAGELRFHFVGGGTTDRVVGVAPEYRAQLVTYMGSERGNALADATGANADTHRLFITPDWRIERAGR